jgi:hydroxypyruvate isomerase
MDMATFAPNISWLFPELPFSQRPDAVVQLGFQALEFGFPSHADIEAIASAQERYGFEVTLFNQDVPVWDEANRGYLADPSRFDEYCRTLDQALEIVGRLDVKKVMLAAGIELPSISREAQKESILENLRYAAPLAEQAEVIFTLEVLNPIDNPGYFLTSSAEAVEIVREVDHPHIRFQFDTYHLGLMEGHLLETLLSCSDVLGHIQFADVPGRHEPGTGEIHFEELATNAKQVGYEGPIGLEYIPLKTGAAALAWCETFRAKQSG